tara:strand:+ start:2017 stop:2187 length:171 start_codon:yes stop_codon:yes gene_type:complete
MTITYKFFKKTGTSTDGSVNQYEDGAFRKAIPLDTANVDYKEFLEWSKTNTAEASD